MQPIGPPSTVQSAPERLLPSLDTGLPSVARFQFRPRVTLSTEYTDNFNLTERDKESNFRSAVAPGIDIGINTALTKGLIAYTFTPAYDTANEEFTFFHSLLGRVVWQANPRWELTVADTLTRSDQPADADRLGLRQERRTFTTNTFALSSVYRIGLVQTQQSYNLMMFTDDSGADTLTHLVGASAVVPITQLNSLSAGYEYLRSDSELGSDTTFQGQSLGVAGDESSIRGHEFTLGASRQFSTFNSGGLKASYALRNATDAIGDTDFQLWNFSAFVRYALPNRLTINASLGVSGIMSDIEDHIGPNLFSATSVSYFFGPAVVSVAFDSGYSETFATGQNFGVVETQVVTGSFGYSFTPTLHGTISGAYRHTEPTGIGNQSVTTDTETLSGSVALTWRFQRRLVLDLNYTHLEQISGAPSLGRGSDGSYSENRVRAALSVLY